MRDMNNLKNAFGEADDGFKTNVYRTLAALQKSEERKPVKKVSLRLAVVIAIACMVITTTALALANTWGILDFITSRSNVEVLPDAAKIIQKDVPQKGGQSECWAQTQARPILLRIWVRFSAVTMARSPITHAKITRL